MTQRPTSVSVIAGFLFVATVIAIGVGLSILFPNPLMDRPWEWNKPGAALFRKIGAIAGLFLLALAVGTALAGSGLLRGRRSAWWFAVVLFTVDGAGDVISFFVTGELLRTLVGVTVSGGFLSALLRTNVRRYFFPDQVEH